MNYTQLATPVLSPLSLNREQCGQRIGQLALFDRMAAAEWLKPVINEHKCTLYDIADVDACFVRLKNGETPPRTGTTTKLLVGPSSRVKRLGAFDIVVALLQIGVILFGSLQSIA